MLEILLRESEMRQTFIEDEAVLRLDALPLDGDILRNWSIFPADASHPCNIDKYTWSKI